MAPHADLFLIHGDVIKRRQLNPEIVERVAGRLFKLVANLPYQIASPLIATLLIEHPNCTGQWVTIQREVADRLMATPGGKDYGPLSVIVQAMAQVRRIAILSPSCFWPEPEVTSAMIAITPKSGDRLSPEDAREFARFVTTLFTKRRKQLGGIIGRAHVAWPELQAQGITPDLRPDALSVDQLITLWRITRT
jgi:16S rRNA (adenine1518-N6/adenine1519-N6)-dimethyltransferase